MAWTLAFSVSQGVDSTSFVLTDQSTGSDSNAVSRRVVCTLNDGTTLVNPDAGNSAYTPFPFSDGATITMYVLPIDYSIAVELQYVDVNGTALYSLSQNYCFTGNDEDFDYSLTQQLVGNQSLLQDTNYVTNRFAFRTLIDAATQATVIGNSINSSQFLLDLAQVYVQNEPNFF